MKAILTTLVILLLAITTYIYLNSYRSAFEADQACHFNISTIDKKENNELGCDHDLETRQWILYEVASPEIPAKVIKRFRY